VQTLARKINRDKKNTTPQLLLPLDNTRSWERNNIEHTRYLLLLGLEWKWRSSSYPCDEEEAWQVPSEKKMRHTTKCTGAHTEMKRLEKLAHTTRWSEMISLTTVFATPPHTTHIQMYVQKKLQYLRRYVYLWTLQHNNVSVSLKVESARLLARQGATEEFAWIASWWSLQKLRAQIRHGTLANKST